MLKNKFNIPKFFIVLPSFYFFAWVMHTLLLSIVGFFHFRLDHKLIVIENWIYDFSWNLALVSKLISFILFSRFFFESRKRNVSDVLFGLKSYLPGYEVVVASLMSFGFFVYFIGFELGNNVLFTFDRFLIHSFAIFVVIFLDLLIFSLIDKQPHQNPLVKIIFTTFFVSLSFITTFPFGDNLTMAIPFLFSLVFAFFYLLKRSFVDSMSFVAIVVIPLFALGGVDPVWGQKYALFIPKSESITIYSFSLMIAFITYFSLIYRKRSLL